MRRIHTTEQTSGTGTLRERGRSVVSCRVVPYRAVLCRAISMRGHCLTRTSTCIYVMKLSRSFIRMCRPTLHVAYIHFTAYHGYYLEHFA